MYSKSFVLNRVVKCSSYIHRRVSADSSKKLLEFLAGMPKANSSRIADAQRQRQHIAKKSEKYGPSTVYLQVLGSGAEGAPNTLYMFTDQKRYMFNCGECTQRLAHEHKVKLSRLDHIFITSKTWRNIGGLPGLSLTLQDVGVPNIMLHGPEGLDELYNATKRFVIMKDMNVKMAKCSPSADFVDNVMTVKYVLLGPHEPLIKDLVKDKPVAKRPKMDHADREFEEFIRDDTDYYKPETREQSLSPTKKQYVKPRVKTPVEKIADREKKKTEHALHALQKQSHCSVAYICTLKKRLGTLNLDRCVELGVKPGPMLGQLKAGHDVVLADGTLVMAKDVKTPDDPGPVFIVLDVPDISYLKEAEFSAHFDNGINPPENIPALVVHFTPPHVFHTPTYHSFMKLFGPCTRHLILNAQNSCLGSEAVHRTQHKLHLLDPDIFPLLRDVSVQAVWNAHPPLPKTNSPIRLKGLEELKNKIALAQFQNIINMEGSCKGDCKPAGIADDNDTDKLEFIAGRTLTMFHLRPKKQLDRSAEPKLHIQEYIKETMDVDGFVQSLEQFRRLVDSMRYARSGSLNEYPKVVFLGTGSCIPSKTRNTSAIVIQATEDKSILLDCGEGTYAQLVRFYGPKKVNAFLKTLHTIYISHLHADHHIGLIGVLQARRQAFEETDKFASPDPVYLLAPGQIMSWLTLYDQQFDKIRPEYTLVPNQNLVRVTDGEPPSHVMTSAMLNQIGVQDIRTCHVSHCPNAFGVSIQIQRHKITYSGDTIPCEALVKCGENSTLLIHEATMEDELAEEARIKMHSTTTQAIEVGKQMNAQYTLLTHFSQRYARLPRLNQNILNDNNSVGIAFDNMQITMNDLELLPHMYAPLQLMFADHCVEMELKAAHRARQKERRVSTPSLHAEDKLRKLSPGCRGTVCHLTPRGGLYRESNASRLRQEIKGMTVSGSLTAPHCPRTRSSKTSRNSSPSCNNTKTTPSPTRGRSTSRVRESSIENQFDVIAPVRTVSETSDLCSSRDRLKMPHIALAPPVTPGHVVDTRSKTLSSVSRQSNINRVPDNSVHERSSTSTTASHSHGYGKPLITPMNKRLTLRRDVTRMSSIPKSVISERVSPVARVRSPGPITRKADNRRCSTAPTGVKRDLSKSKIPTAKRTGSVNVLRENSSVVKSEKSPVSRGPAVVKGLKGSTSNSVQIRNSTSPSPTPSRPLSRPSTAKSLSKPSESKQGWNSSTKILRGQSANPSLRDTTIFASESSASSTSSRMSSSTPRVSRLRPRDPENSDWKRSTTPEKCDYKRSSTPEKPDWKRSPTPERSDWKRSTTPEKPDWKRSPTPERSDWKRSTTPEKPDWKRSPTPERSDWKRSTTPEKPDWKRSTTPERSDWKRSTTSEKSDLKRSTTPERPDWKRSTTPDKPDLKRSTTPEKSDSKRSTTPERPDWKRSTTPDKQDWNRSTTPDKLKSRTSTSEKMNFELKNSMPSFRDKLNETIKKQNQVDAKKELKKDLHHSRPNSATHSVRSFKPQLEDIKSSFILMNKKGRKSNDNTKVLLVSKPKPIDESERRKQLEEVRNKFTGPKYYHDAKYEKIEGLNWITWK